MEYRTKMVLAEARAEGRKEGRKEGMLESLQYLICNTGWSVERAMEAIEIPEGERNFYRERLKQLDIVNKLAGSIPDTMTLEEAREERLKDI